MSPKSEPCASPLAGLGRRPSMHALLPFFTSLFTFFFNVLYCESIEFRVAKNHL